MNIRYYLVDSQITVTNYKQTKVINPDDIDYEQYIDCIESPFAEMAYNQFGVTDNISKILYTKIPISLEDQIDAVLNPLKFVTELQSFYKIVDVKKERMRAVIYYIVSIDEVE
jgi:hypothetical protein